MKMHHSFDKNGSQQMYLHSEHNTFKDIFFVFLRVSDTMAVGITKENKSNAIESPPFKSFKIAKELKTPVALKTPSSLSTSNVRGVK